MTPARLNGDLNVHHVGHGNLRLPQTQATGPVRRSIGRYGFAFGFAAIVVTLLLPANLLINLGLHSDEPGGNVLTKLYPWTYLAALGGCIALYGSRGRGGLTRLVRLNPTLGWSIVLMILCTIYSVASAGVAGVAIYLNTYLAAMLIAVSTIDATPRQCRVLGYTLMTFTVLNIVISVLEGATQTHFLPLDPSLQANYDTGVEEFRGQALYEHPLTGALATALAVFLLLGMQLRTWALALLFGILVIGLLSFGGRTALLTSMAVVIAASIGQLAISLARRRLSLKFLGGLTAGALLIPALFLVIITTTDVGMRITSHLYLDDSADVRIIQWRILDLLQFHQVLFGVPAADVAAFKFQVGLAKPGNDIESFPLLMFLNLGLVGLPFYVMSLVLYVLHLGARTRSSTGWLMVLTAMLICSSSNSLGRKVPDLVLLTAFATALRGFAAREAMSPEATVLQTRLAQSGAGITPKLMGPRRMRALVER